MNGPLDIENKIFTECKAAIVAELPEATCKSAEEDRPAAFPFASILEKSNTNYLKTADDTSRENHAQLMYELNFYDNSISGKKANVKKMVTAASAYFASIGFNRTFCQPVPNATDTNIYRMTARYEAVLGANNHIYTE